MLVFPSQFRGEVLAVCSGGIVGECGHGLVNFPGILAQAGRAGSYHIRLGEGSSFFELCVAGFATELICWHRIVPYYWVDESIHPIALGFPLNRVLVNLAVLHDDLDCVDRFWGAGFSEPTVMGPKDGEIIEGIAIYHQDVGQRTFFDDT